MSISDKGTRVLVAGGAGFIGVNLIHRLLSLGAKIRATIHMKSPVIFDDRLEYLHCDLTKKEDCREAVKGMDYVFLCAAKSSGAGIITSNPLAHVTENIIINAETLEAAYLAKVKKLVWLSSNAAYPPSGKRPVREEEMFNGDPHDVYFAAGWMKRYTEVLCKMYSEKLNNPITTVVVRPSNLYGPYDDFNLESSHVMAALIRKVVERHDPIEVWGTGDDVRDWLYIDDFVDALLLATEKMEFFDPINIGLGKGHSIKEALQILLEIDGFADANIKFNPLRPSTIPIRLIDTTKAEGILGFRPKTDLRQGVQKTLEWYRHFAS